MSDEPVQVLITLVGLLVGLVLALFAVDGIMRRWGP